ncbi:MAG TPA: DinB family protein [Gemmatimonadaceae bacterium]|jgi:hypothetical protein|nr:DinB family protein [Gemmatimonadaceae bacterium]
MQRRIAEVLGYLDTTRDALQRTLAEIPPELRERRPSPESWSVAEVLQHLALTEGRITEVVAGCMDRVRESGFAPEHETTPVGASFDIDRVLDRSRPVVASDAVLPVEPLGSNAAWERLERCRAKLRELVISADGLPLAKVTVPNRVLGPLDGYQWTLFAGAHEARHTAQIREIGERLLG